MIYTYQSQTIESSYKNLCNKMTLASLSYKDYALLATTPIIDPDASGLSHCYKTIINQKTNNILEYSASIWHNISLLKELVNLRGEIKEKHMQSIDESKELLDSTKKLQEFVHAISEQEETFLSLYDKLNQHIFDLYNRFSQQDQEIQSIFASLVDKSMHQAQLSLDKSLYPSNDIVYASTVLQLTDLFTNNRIGDFFSSDILSWALEQNDNNSIKGFLTLQVWIHILARFVRKESTALKTNQDAIDAKALYKSVHQVVEEESIQLPKEEIDPEETQLVQKLSQRTELNKAFYEKIKNSFEKLKILSDNRKDPEEQPNEKQEEDGGAQGQEAA